MMKEPVLGVRVYTDHDREMRLAVRGGLHHIKSNHAPYFSLTADIYEKRGRESWEDVGGGCCHDLILRFFPKFAPMAALHLSDIDGIPMHGSANGYYWLAGAMGGLCERYHGGTESSCTKRTPEQCLEIFANLVRIPHDQAAALVKSWEDSLSPSGYSARELGKFKDEVFPAWIEAQKTRWKQEAVDCITQFSLVVYGDKWPE